jgi:hypothetical protein
MKLNAKRYPTIAKILNASPVEASVFEILVKNQSGEELGRLTPEQFRKGLEAPQGMFLDDVVKKFNELNKNESAEVVLRKLNKKD